MQKSCRKLHVYSYQLVLGTLCLRIVLLESKVHIQHVPIIHDQFAWKRLLYWDRERNLQVYLEIVSIGGTATVLQGCKEPVKNILRITLQSGFKIDYLPHNNLDELLGYTCHKKVWHLYFDILHPCICNKQHRHPLPRHFDHWQPPGIKGVFNEKEKGFENDNGIP